VQLNSCLRGALIEQTCSNQFLSPRKKEFLLEKAKTFFTGHSMEQHLALTEKGME
jgi:hypothetical protein